MTDPSLTPPLQMNMADQKGEPARLPDIADRMVISPQGKYVLNGTEVVLMGGNYLLKAPPYFPPLDVVKEDAKLFAEGVQTMKYTPAPASNGSARQVVPIVRLGALWEGAMPDQSGVIDATWAARLDETVAAFKEQGVYVFLDCHQDAVCTTNGGEGMPWWVSAEMQRTDSSGCCGFRSCCCFTCGSASYLTSPEHPLQSVIPLPECLLKRFGMNIVTQEGDPDPWRPYSVGSGDGNPASMNIGNASMRLNNFDIEWGKLGNTKQANNMWNRFIASPFQPSDKQLMFRPFMTYIKHLCAVWKKHSNVIAVDLWNEPLVSGLLPCNLCRLPFSIRQTYDFFGAVLAELDADGITAPVCVEELPTGGLTNMTCITKCLGCVPISSDADSLLKQWAQRGQLILEFHYYPGIFMVDGVKDAVDKAKQRAAQLGDGVPIFLGEFWPGSGTVADSQAGANLLAQFADAGCDASAYWLYANTKFTEGNPGWYRYTPAMQAAGGPRNKTAVKLNMDVWPEYEHTVRKGTSWGAHITGMGTGIMGVLELVPATSSS
eukprot:TRINITY_DN56566_c0_g1_i1.p1 TRINITY_DN56566_c0_g1~~TRINITY_DN56566_c0_g1_i1.p1  ORF type:complete len:547 (-),score=67.51 TRINITY_DN56566_c0_g1_i1:519-2159(-)